MALTAMEPSLLFLLEKNDVHADVKAFLEGKRVFTVDHLASYCDSRDQVETKILSKVQACKDDDSQLARVKMAWRQADAIAERALKRTADGLEDEAVDDPLPDGVQKSIEDAWDKAYSWGKLKAQQRGCDSLLARIFREFKKGSPTLFAVSKVRSLAYSQKGKDAKRTKLGGKYSLYCENDEEPDDEVVGTFYGYIDRLEVLTNTWSIAGVFDVEKGGLKVRFCGWSQACDYLRTIKDQAAVHLTDCSESSVVEYAIQVEEAFRIKCIEVVRGSEKLTWGEALELVETKWQYVWDTKKDCLAKKGRPVELRSREAADKSVRDRPVKGKGNGKGDAGPSKNGWKNFGTVKVDSTGATICKFFNDSRGCKGKNKCPQGRVHCCDVRLAAGGVCGSTSHARVKHNPSQHGVPAKRE